MADDVLVVYLALDGWVEQERAWATSYMRFSSGIEHSLETVRRSVGEPGYDIGAMLDAAKTAAQKGFSTMVFLGSHSRILADDWLLKLVEGSEFGAASATGSYEQGISSYRYNPHLRTNAFAIDPSLLLSLWTEPVMTKRDCHEFEHGDNSITRRLVFASHTPVVASTHGVHRMEYWPHSGTYRRFGYQPHLLVADNRTDAYFSADHATKRHLEQLAWGSNPFIQISDRLS